MKTLLLVMNQLYLCISIKVKVSNAIVIIFGIMRGKALSRQVTRKRVNFMRLMYGTFDICPYH
jgi:hypothetical protein